MEQENASVQEDVVEQEEQTSQEETEETSYEEETVTIPKSKFVKIQRKAKAYDSEKEKPRSPITTNSDTKWRERMELKVDGYDEEAIDFIQKNGGKKSLENPYITKAIEAMREQRAAEKATIDEGSKSQTEKRFTQKEFAKLSASEQLKVLSELN